MNEFFAKAAKKVSAAVGSLYAYVLDDVRDSERLARRSTMTIECTLAAWGDQQAQCAGFARAPRCVMTPPCRRDSGTPALGRR